MDYFVSEFMYSHPHIYLRNFLFFFKPMHSLSCNVYMMRVKVLNLQYRTLSPYVRSQMHAPTPNYNLCYVTPFDFIIEKLVPSSSKVM